MNNLNINEKHEEILEAIWTSTETGRSDIELVRKHCAVDFSDTDLDFLEQQNLISRKKDTILFVGQGKKHARAIVRRHRLAEVLVSSILKLKNADMDRVACELEHSLLPEVEEAICTLLGHPDYCPDGNPIPEGSCCKNRISVINKTAVPMKSLNPGESGKVAYIKPDSHSTLQQLISFGFQPGIFVTVKQTSPAVCIRYENTELALDKDIAGKIYVWKTE